MSSEPVPRTQHLNLASTAARKRISPQDPRAIRVRRMASRTSEQGRPCRRRQIYRHLALRPDTHAIVDRERFVMNVAPEQVLTVELSGAHAGV